jgi:hypothetical protein
MKLKFISVGALALAQQQFIVYSEKLALPGSAQLWFIVYSENFYSWLYLARLF